MFAVLGCSPGVLMLQWLDTFSQQQVYPRICNEEEGCGRVAKPIRVNSY